MHVHVCGCVCVRVYVCVCVLPLRWSMGNAWNCTQPFTVGSAVRGAHSKATQWDPGCSLKALAWLPITSRLEASVRSRVCLGLAHVTSLCQGFLMAPDYLETLMKLGLLA